VRAVIHLFAAIILLGTTAWWWQAGSNKGWTKTSVQVLKYDEITEISYPEYEDRFVPGMDILGGAAIAAAVLTGAGFLLRKRLRPEN
jgi:hypothetical protein